VIYAVLLGKALAIANSWAGKEYQQASDVGGLGKRKKGKYNLVVSGLELTWIGICEIEPSYHERSPRKLLRPLSSLGKAPGLHLTKGQLNVRGPFPSNTEP
jgi:hypothetical protein